MTKETKFYTWLIGGLVAVGAIAWWMQKNAATGAPPSGAKVTP